MYIVEKYSSAYFLVSKNIILMSFSLSLLIIISSNVYAEPEPAWPSKTTYHVTEVQGEKIFYRKAGDPSNPTILLLHGYPSSSHSYRELIPLLSGNFHIIAPDNLGSGYSGKPDPENVRYTFDLLAEYIEGLVKNLNIENYTLYMQDFGAPVGYRLILKQPEKLKALIVQNANAYLEGLTPKRQTFFKSAHEDKSKEKLNALYGYTGVHGVQDNQYLRDVQDRTHIMSPDSWTHDLHFLETDKQRKIQVQLFQDYYNNLLSYGVWQEFLRKNRPPTLIVWGKNDPAFIAEGAKAYLKDVPDAELHLLDAGHFAAEELPVKIAKLITTFLQK